MNITGAQDHIKDAIDHLKKAIQELQIEPGHWNDRTEKIHTATTNISSVKSLAHLCLREVQSL